MQLLFVYGTLKQGFRSNKFLQNSKYIGIAKTKPIYGMYAFRGYPALITQPLAIISEVKAESSILGELYEVNESTLQQLDVYEGVESNLFKRQLIELDSITLVGLPCSKSAYEKIASKNALAYIFQQNIKGAADCSPIWHLD